MNSIAIIGCGNMGSALARVLPSSRLKICCYDSASEKSKELASLVSGKSVAEVSMLHSCDTFLIGCKPAQFEELAKSLKAVSKDKLIISMMAGKKIEEVSKALDSVRVVRIMPSTPVLVGRGVITGCFSDKITSREKEELITFFGKGPLFHPLKEEYLIDLTTGYTGSGPAYVFEIVRIMSEKLIDEGFEREVAVKLISETFAGSAELLLKSELSPEQLRNNVASKGGTTEAALNIFKDRGLENIFNEALAAAFEKTKTL